MRLLKLNDLSSMPLFHLNLSLSQSLVFIAKVLILALQVGDPTLETHRLLLGQLCSLLVLCLTDSLQSLNLALQTAILLLQLGDFKPSVTLGSLIGSESRKFSCKLILLLNCLLMSLH